MQQISGPIFEDKVVDFILEMAKVSDVVIDKDTLYRADETAAPAKKATKKSTKKATEKKAAAKKVMAKKAPAKKPANKKAAAKK